ncbi:hypothetical protein D6C99_02294 [Aureobasidium pullulans]|nr:hypothetical protein D6D29_02086 [Aureobasidium pullulans]THY58184.1 hypothetical protein D6C99_02294 [Aureobasidium pullulans]
MNCPLHGINRMSSKIDALNDLPMHQHQVGPEDNMSRVRLTTESLGVPISEFSINLDKNAIESLPFNDEAAAVTAQSFAVQITGWRLVDHAGRPSFAAVSDSISIKLLCPSSYTRQTFERGLPGHLRIKTTNLAESP